MHDMVHKNYPLIQQVPIVLNQNSENSAEKKTWNENLNMKDNNKETEESEEN